MAIYWHGSLKIDNLVERIIHRLYGICFGDEEYLDCGFKIAKGITIRLIDDISMDKDWDVIYDIDYKTITLKKNSEKTNKMCWFSLVSSSIEIQKNIRNGIYCIMRGVKE